MRTLRMKHFCHEACHMLSCWCIGVRSLGRFSGTVQTLSSSLKLFDHSLSFLSYLHFLAGGNLFLHYVCKWIHQLVLKQLDPIHHQGLHVVLGVFRTSSAQCPYVETHEPSLTSRRLKLLLNYVLNTQIFTGKSSLQLYFRIPKCQTM